MRVEIVGLDDRVAKCRVTDSDGRAYQFAVGSSEPAHQLLRLMIHNASRAIAEARVKEQMDAFAADARRGF